MPTARQTRRLQQCVFQIMAGIDQFCENHQMAEFMEQPGCCLCMPEFPFCQGPVIRHG